MTEPAPENPEVGVTTIEIPAQPSGSFEDGYYIVNLEIPGREEGDPPLVAMGLKFHEDASEAEVAAVLQHFPFVIMPVVDALDEQRDTSEETP